MEEEEEEEEEDYGVEILIKNEINLSVNTACDGEDVMSIYIPVVASGNDPAGGENCKAKKQQEEQDQTLKLDYPAMPNWEQRLRIFENKVLRKIFGAKRDEVTGEWRKLHNAELHILFSSPDIIRNIKARRLRWAGHVARTVESRITYRVLVGRPEGKRPLGRPRRRWEDNIKMDLREVGYDDMQSINLAQDRDRWRTYVRAAMNLQVP
ncbi:hypothetical protein ANN_11658 [Periplaneta americana]|uniref:Uncharacterized protein n=1 Tax=Periplaneta americana TaxID=6978 RepID=A0ABQ8T7E1_PERAM|nr:hypothetical protein ANN_11658 [Periplaneta americana]